MLIDTYETKVSRATAPALSTRLADPAYRKRLLADATAAIAEFGFSGAVGEDMVVLENTPKVQNVVVCTLAPATGQPGFRPSGTSRLIALAPSSIRAAWLRELGEDVPAESKCARGTAELRYLVLPEPRVTEGWSDELSKSSLATR